MAALSSSNPGKHSAARADTLAVALLAAIFFGFLARYRIVDDDEGYYALAGRALVRGQWPYRDFFFPQMPLSAAAYGAVSAVFGPGLGILRAFAAACAVGTTLLVAHAARRIGSRSAGLVAAVLFTTHSLVWEWEPTVKTFPLALLFGMGALVLATTGEVTSRRAAAAGFSAGLATCTRLLGLPLVLGVVWAFAASPRDRRARSFASLGAGFAAGLAPAVFLCVADARAFAFDNLGYHALRSPGEGLFKDAAQKLETARAVFLSPWGAARTDATGIQMTALVAFATLALTTAGREPRARLAPYYVAALALVVVSFLPSPSWAQYFVAAVPPASVLAGTWLASAARRRGTVPAALAAYTLVAIPAFRDRIFDQPRTLRVANVDRVGRALDRVTVDGDRVAAHWPSYLVASHRAPLPAAQNQYARIFSNRISAEERAAFHFYTEAEFRDALLRRDAKAFVVGTFVVPRTAMSLRAAGFTRSSERLLGATIWLAPP